MNSTRCYEEEDACHRSLFTIGARAVYEEEDACHRSLFTRVAPAVYEEEDACHSEYFFGYLELRKDILKCFLPWFF